jgi:Rrf2 family protein
MPSFARISEASSLALHTMALLAKNPKKRLSTPQIASVIGGSSHHLRKVMRRLVKAGMVASFAGPGGGFQLLRPPGRTTLLQIYEAVEGPISGETCLLGEPICSGRRCLIGDLLHSVHVQIRDRLAETSLAELTESAQLMEVAG